MIDANSLKNGCYSGNNVCIKLLLIMKLCNVGDLLKIL
jgi:hypothetical protein